MFVIYQFPSTSVLTFCNDLANVLEESILNLTGYISLVGDFNIHVDQVYNSDSITFSDFLDSFGLSNKVQFPTHKHQPTLDLVISCCMDGFIQSVFRGHLLSDHNFVHWKLRVGKEDTVLTETTWSTKDFNHSRFSWRACDKLQDNVVNTGKRDLGSLVDAYNRTLTNIMDDLALEKTKALKVNHRQLWFNDKILQELKLRRWKERVWRQDPTEYNYRAFYNQCRFVSNTIKTAPQNFYLKAITDNKNNYKYLFNLTNGLLFWNQESNYPDAGLKEELAECFSEFFKNKIDKIMRKLKSDEDGISIGPQYLESESQTSCRFSEFRLVSEDELASIIKATPTKSCDSDPITTKLLKEHLDSILPALVKIVTTSFQDSAFLDNLREALLRPLIKKNGLELVFTNFRPVSNLSYLSKLIERVVCGQLVDMMTETGNYEGLQSAYQSQHSTEMALLKVKTNILDNMDKGHVNCLVMLDLLAALDMVNYQYLMDWLRYRFELDGKIIEWISNYLQDRTQKVVVDNVKSESVCLNQGVPQGLVLGPILFSLFILPLGDICHKHNFCFHSYADDQQVYLSFDPSIQGDKELCVKSLEACIHNIQIWMKTNLLKLNNSKTEVILIGTNQKQSKVSDDITIRIGNDDIKPMDIVRNLGFYWCSDMKNTARVNQLTSRVFPTICNITKIQHLLDKSMMKMLVQALVLSKVDYCNSLLLGSSQYNIRKLQRLQNMCARIIYRACKYDGITPLLMELHWLKIEERIEYKVAVLVYKGVTKTALTYLKELVISEYG